MTVLLRVQDWGWHLYKVTFSRTEDGPIVHEDELIASSGDEERAIQERCDELFGQLSEGAWYKWEPLEQFVEARLRFETGGIFGGTRVVGAGWKSKGDFK